MSQGIFCMYKLNTCPFRSERLDLLSQLLTSSATNERKYLERPITTTQRGVKYICQYLMLCAAQWKTYKQYKNNPITRGKRLVIRAVELLVIILAGGGEWFSVDGDLSIVYRDDYALAADSSTRLWNRLNSICVTP